MSLVLKKGGPIPGLLSSLFSLETWKQRGKDKKKVVVRIKIKWEELRREK